MPNVELDVARKKALREMNYVREKFAEINSDLMLGKVEAARARLLKLRRRGGVLQELEEALQALVGYANGDGLIPLADTGDAS